MELVVDDRRSGFVPAPAALDSAPHETQRGLEAVEPVGRELHFQRLAGVERELLEAQLRPAVLQPLRDAAQHRKREQARNLCIALEFLAGLSSPDEDRDQRMKYQVDRLAQSMSGVSIRQPASDEALEAEKTWLGLYALPEADFTGFGKRIKRALSAILETV